MKRKLLLLCLCTVTSIFVVASLYFVSAYVKTSAGSFYRSFPPHPVLENKNTTLQYNSYYLAGSDDSQVYLGNSTAPLSITSISTDSTIIEEHVIKIRHGENLKYFPNHRVLVDSPSFYFVDGAVPYIFKGALHNWHADEKITDSIYFQDLTPLRGQEFALRTISRLKRENVLGLLDAKQSLNLHYDILTKQVDGIFCTNGMLLSSEDKSKIVYLYYYRNEFIILDDQLSAIARGHTIDTTTKAKIEIVSRLVGDRRSIQLATPPPSVNRHACIYKDWLLVHSNLMAKNENEKAFEQSSVIDVYDLKTTAYVLSFYLPDRRGKKVKGLAANRDDLFVLYDTQLDSYRFNRQLFP